MENINPSSEGKTKNKSLESVLGWIIGVILGIFGFITLFLDFIPGLFLLLAGLFIIKSVRLFTLNKLHLSLGRKFKIGLTVALLIIAVMAMDSKPKAEVEIVQENVTQPVVVQKDVQTVNEPVVQKIEQPTVQANTAPVVPKQAPAPVPQPQTERADMLIILKANASAKWGDNYQMVKYEYDNQVEAYDWVASQTKYPNIMTKAKQKWGHNYQMVRYEYENQVEAYESL